MGETLDLSPHCHPGVVSGAFTASMKPELQSLVSMTGLC